MVEISRASPREASRKKKPIWLLAAYALFALSCLDAFRTYRNQKELVQLKFEEKRARDADDTRYSAGAEEHVVTTGVGSSQYGGSVRARDNTKKNTKKIFGENFLGIRPVPGDGSKDYSATHEDLASDFKGFRFYVMAGTSVRGLSCISFGGFMIFFCVS